MKGIIITFEGIDGSGKSTVIKHLVDLLHFHHYQVLVIQEPGTTTIGRKIRAVLKSAANRTPLTDTLLYEASRANMIATELIPNLENYDYILLDRYVDSTIAYQCCGGGMDLKLVTQLNEIASQNIQPRHRFLIDVDLETAEKRRQLRKQTSDTKDEFDTKIEFAKRVYNGYQQMVYDHKLISIPNNHDSRQTAINIWHIIKP